VEADTPFSKTDAFAYDGDGDGNRVADTVGGVTTNYLVADSC